MAKAADLTGRRFGKLTVLEKTDEQQDRYWLWRCRCDCGGETLVNTKRLVRGTVTSCGCIPKTDARRGQTAEDLTGRRFGKLTVLRRAENRNGRVSWVCQCDCGNLHTATAQSLKEGSTTSCGCLRRLNQDGIRDLSGRRFGRLTVLFPTEKRDKKGAVIWRCRCDCGGEIDTAQDNLLFGHTVSCGCRKEEIQQDLMNHLHLIDGTCVEWLKNRKHRSDNTSGFRGVHPTRYGSFQVSIGFKRRRFHVGTYPTFEEAVQARLEAEELIHGGFVKAYYRWQAANTDEPFVFEVEKANGRFQVVCSV